MSVSPRDTEEAQLSPPGDRQGQGKASQKRQLELRNVTCVDGSPQISSCHLLPQEEEEELAR